MSALLRCPFCDGHAQLHSWEDDDVYTVMCDHCDASGRHYSGASEAIAAWNRRATTPGAREAAEAMRERAAGVLAARSAKIREDASYWSGPDMTNSRVLLPEIDALEAAIRALPMPASGWRDMDDKPSRPMPVLYWFGKRWWHNADGTRATLDPTRDPAERTEAGWWSGEEWCESGTGHDLFEPWREERDLPTAWMPLPAAPEGEAT